MKKRKIHSKYLGEVDVNEDQIYIFPDGIIGFSGLREYAILEDPQYRPFSILQSFEEKAVSFIIIDPANFSPDYIVECPLGEIEKIGEKELDSCEVRVIVSIPEKTSEMTANLQGPLLLSSVGRKGIQVISMGNWHVVRFPVFAKGVA